MVLRGLGQYLKVRWVHGRRERAGGHDGTTCIIKQSAELSCTASLLRSQPGASGRETGSPASTLSWGHCCCPALRRPTVPPAGLASAAPQPSSLCQQVAVAARTRRSRGPRKRCSLQHGGLAPTELHRQRCKAAEWPASCRCRSLYPSECRHHLIRTTSVMKTSRACKASCEYSL